MLEFRGYGRYGSGIENRLLLKFQVVFLHFLLKTIDTKYIILNIILNCFYRTLYRLTENFKEFFQRSTLSTTILNDEIN